MTCNIHSIQERFNSGEALEFLFFWGHTAEQYMMAQKALLFGDSEMCAKIMAADNPRDYKALGRLVRGFDPKVWDKRKFDIVCDGNRARFSQNPELAEFLLGTGESVLVEASPYDGVWGVKRSMDDPLIRNPNHWLGQNLLGFALMETRDGLKTILSR